MIEQTQQASGSDPKANHFLAQLEREDYDALMLEGKIGGSGYISGQIIYFTSGDEVVVVETYQGIVLNTKVGGSANVSITLRGTGLVACRSQIVTTDAASDV